MYDVSYLEKLFQGGTWFQNIFSKTISIFLNTSSMLKETWKNNRTKYLCTYTLLIRQNNFPLQKLKHLQIILDNRLKAPQNNFSVGQRKLFHGVVYWYPPKKNISCGERTPFRILCPEVDSKWFSSATTLRIIRFLWFDFLRQFGSMCF